MLKSLLRLFDIDHALMYVLAARVWQAASGPVTIVLVIETLTLKQQGIYYGLIGIVGIQAFFELGLLNVLISHAGHEVANLRQGLLDSESDRNAASDARNRLKQLVLSSKQWFLYSSLLFAVSALAFGHYTLQHVPMESRWQNPLWILVPISAISFAYSPSIAILEGAGYRLNIYRARFGQLIAGSFVVWAALLLGWGLWSIVMAAAVQALITVLVVNVQFAFFFSQFQADRDESRLPARQPNGGFSWSRDILPSQWRTAAISLSHYLATQLSTLIVLLYHSAEDAGRLGMTLTITTALQMLALAWLQSNFSVISAEHARNGREFAGTRWRRVTLISTSVLVAGLGTMIIGVSILPDVSQSVSNRFLTAKQLAILAVGIVANHLIASQGLYILSKRLRPITWAPFIGFLCTAVAVWWGGRAFSVSGAVTAYSLGVAFIALPLCTWRYLIHRRAI